MPGTAGPNLGLVWGYAAHEDGWGLGSYSPGFAALDTVVQLAVIDEIDTPPGSPANGDRYIVGTAPTGAWSGHGKSIAVWLTTGTPAWLFLGPKRGWQAFNFATSLFHYFDGTNWVEPPTLPAQVYGIAFSAPQTTAYSGGQVIGHHPVSKAIQIPANFGAAGGRVSQAMGSANATASTVFSVQKCTAASDPTNNANWTEIGTITFAAAGVTPTFATASSAAQSLAAGDRLRIVAPASADATFAGFACNLAAVET